MTRNEYVTIGVLHLVELHAQDGLHRRRGQPVNRHCQSATSAPLDFGRAS
jgi:hypothetical protein